MVIVYTILGFMVTVMLVMFAAAVWVLRDPD